MHLTTIKSLKRLKKIIKDNKFYFIFILLNVINPLMLRMFTLGSGALFDFDALLAEIAFLFIVGSFSFLFRDKGRFIYLLIVTIILTAICVINSAYYTFYTSFASISLLSTARFVTDVGDAVVENVLQPKDLIYIMMPLSLKLLEIFMKFFLFVLIIIIFLMS